MNQHQAKRLAATIQKARTEHSLSARQLAERADVAPGTITRLERAEILTPQIDSLRRIADALDLPITDLLASGSWVRRDELPSLPLYLRTKYRGMPSGAVDEIESQLDEIAKRHGIRLDEYTGPMNGEDE